MDVLELCRARRRRNIFLSDKVSLVDKEASSGFLPAKSFTKVLSTKKNETTNVPTTLNGCPFSMMLNPFLMSAVVAVPARTCFMCDVIWGKRGERD